MVEEVKKKTNGRYTFLAPYVDDHTKIPCKCNECGNVWDITPNSILAGHGCPKCNKGVKRSNDEFVALVKDQVGDEYIFEEPYINNSTKILCKHSVCGYEWSTLPSNFLKGKRCPKCAGHMKLTDEEFKKRVKDQVGDEYIFEEPYINSSTKILCKHSVCGHEWSILPTNFMRGKRCPKCAGRVTLTNEEFQERIKNLVGDEYIFEEPYINSSTKILCKHSVCGYEWEVNPGTFLSGTRCPKCAGRTRTPESFRKEISDLTQDEYHVLGEYKTANTKVLMEHTKCGFKYEVTPGHFLSGKRCPKCAGLMRKTDEYFKKEVFDLVGNLYEFSGKYKNTETKMHVKHNVCGYEYEVTPAHFLGGERCPKCSGCMKLTDEEFKKRVKKLVGDEYIFTEPYINSTTKIQCVHSTCGHKWKIAPNNFFGGRGCPECARSAFLGEVDIRAYLNEHSITYVHDISIRELFVEHLGYSKSVYTDFMGKFVKSINTLDDKAGFGKMIDRFHISRARFDFYIFSDEDKKKLAGLIEYDGEQHFKFVQYFFQSLKDFAYRHSADRVKDSFAEFFNIPLIRIAYFQKDQINAMLNDFFTRPEYYKTQHNTYLTNEEYEACFDETDALADMKDFKFES